MNLAIPGISSLGPTELIIILVILVFLFGAKKLPDMARGTGRALRIFKSETKGLMDDEEDQQRTPTATTDQPQITQSPAEPSPPAPPAQQPTAEQQHQHPER